MTRHMHRRGSGERISYPRDVNIERMVGELSIGGSRAHVVRSRKPEGERVGCLGPPAAETMLGPLSSYACKQHASPWASCGQVQPAMPPTVPRHPKTPRELLEEAWRGYAGGGMEGW